MFSNALEMHNYFTLVDLNEVIDYADLSLHENIIIFEFLIGQKMYSEHWEPSTSILQESRESNHKFSTDEEIIIADAKNIMSILIRLFCISKIQNVMRMKKHLKWPNRHYLIILIRYENKIVDLKLIFTGFTGRGGTVRLNLTGDRL